MVAERPARKGERLLALETSCDDTCAAVLDGPRILSSVISSQDAAHERFGGIVPEVASRQHLELTVPVVEAALAEAGTSLDEVDAVARSGTVRHMMSASSRLSW